MAKISESDILKEIILAKEIELKNQEVELREQVHLFYESLKPVNIIKNAFNKVFKQGNLSSSIADAALGIIPVIIEYKAGKIDSGKPIKKILGSIVSALVGSLIAKNTETIKSAGNQIIDAVFSKEEKEDEE